MEIEELFGLPAHPLVVHAVVVLLPLAAITAIACAVMPRARRHYAPAALALALAATLASWSRSTPGRASACSRGRSAW